LLPAVFVKVNCGEPLTVNVSFAVLPVPPFVEVTLPLVLFFTPAVVAVTSTVTVQEPLAAIVPALKVNVVLPAAGAKVGAPQLVVVAFGVAATSKPAGKASVKATPVNAVPVFGFVIVKVKVEVPPTAIGSGAKFFAIEGALKTARVSFAVLPVPPLVEDTFPVVLFFTPLVVAVTSTVTVQLPLAGIVPPAKVNVVLPAAGAKVGVPQLLVVTFGVAATSKPAGKASVNATPVNAVPVFGFVIVKVSVEVPPTAIGSGAKFFAIDGALKTVNVSVPVLPVPPFVEVILPVVLILAPMLVAVTVTITVQLLFTGSIVPLKITLGVGRVVARTDTPPGQVVD